MKYRYPSKIVLLSLFTALTLSAKDTDWVGTSGGSFSNTALWSDGVPGVDDRVRFRTSGTYTIELDSSRWLQ